jgi:16S rRNA (guanine527-N7)-methyltransferase
MTPIEDALGLDARQRGLLDALEAEALAINRRVNLYSAASAAAFRARHVRHSLAIASRAFPAGAVVVDWGTGGGMPGLPLAIAFPETQFILVDSVGKKVRAVQTMARRLGLDNVEGWHGRAEAFDGACHYAVSRATAPLADLYHWTARVRQPLDAPEDAWAPGIIALKGGELTAEVAAFLHAAPGWRVEMQPLTPLLGDAHFDDKVLLHAAAPAGE